MAYDGSIRINTKIDTAGFSTGVNKMKQGLSTVTDKVGGLVRKMTALAGIAGLAAFAKSALDAASDLQEVQNVVDTAFGSMSQKCEDFSKSALKNFGLSEYAAKKMASTYMAMGKSMGLSMDYASDMAISVSERTADIASFYNLTAEEASTKLKSIYTGETETLKSLGVVMTEANLKQYALSQGITKSYKDMDQAEKVMLRYGFVMQATNDAAGDFARTSDSWANQTKMLSENFNALKTTLGGFLITVLSPAIKGLNSMVQVITNVITAVRTAMSDLFGIEFQEVTSSAGAAVEDVSDGMGDLAENTKEATKQQNKQNRALASFDKLNKLSAKTSSGGSSTKNKSGSGSGSSFTVPITKSNNALGEAGKKLDNITKKIKSLLSWVKKLITPLKEFALSDKGFPRFFEITKKLADSINWSKVKKAVEDLAEALTILAELTWTALMDFYEEFLVPIGTWTMNKALPKLASWMKTVAERLKRSKLLDNLKGLWKILSKFATDIGTGLIDFFTGMADVALDYILSLDWDTFNDALGHLLNIISNVVTNVGAGIVAFFKGIQPVVSWLTNMFIQLLKWLFEALDWFLSLPACQVVIKAVGAAIATFLTGLAAIKIKNAISNTIKNISSAAGDLIKVVMSHPYLAIAAAFAALAIGIVKFVDATHKNPNAEWADNIKKDVKTIHDDVEDCKTKLQDLKTEMETGIGEAEGEANYIQYIADAYFRLQSNAHKTNKEQEQMEQYAEILKSKLGSYQGVIDETTGALTNNKNAIYDAIKAMKKQAIQAAMQSQLEDYYKTLSQLVIERTKALEEEKEAEEAVSQAQKEKNDFIKKYGAKAYTEEAGELQRLDGALTKAKDAQMKATKEVKNANDAVVQYKGEIKTLQKGIDTFEVDSLITEVDSANGVFKGLGDDYGTEFGNEYAKGFKSGITDKENGLQATAVSEYDGINDKASKAGENAGKKFSKAFNTETDWRYKVELDSDGKTKKKAHGGIFARGSWRDLPHYAAGMPYGVRGSLFIAGEAGPEIVAQGRSGSSEILNASQIASAIYSAVSSAMKGSSGNVTVKLMGDADRLFDVIVEKNTRNTLVTNHNAMLG